MGTVVRARKAEFGDLQINAAMQLSKAEKKPPREIAARILEAVKDHDAVAKAEIAGPGFVNIFIKDAWLAAQAGSALAVRRSAAGQRVVIDYSSPNVAKPMHIGHIRSTIIGDAIKRALRAVGYEVVADNHLGDWGTQFGKLIVAYRKWLDADAFQRAPVAELLRLYIKFQEESKTKEDDDLDAATPLVKEARAELVKLQQGDPENLALWQKFVDVSMNEFNRVYQRLGVEFDVLLGESFYNDRLAGTVERLVKEGIAEESQGALVVFFRKPDGSDEMPPAIVQKGDGGFNYATTDVAGVLYRVERWSPARIIILTDERQQLHFRQFFAIARRLGVTCSLEHVWFGLMRLPEGTISTREGKLIGLEALLDEAESRAFEVATQASAELPEADRREIARVVGLGAVKYNDLSKDRQTLVTFTWDKALSLTGNSGPYLQYAYARIQSILRKGKQEHAAEPGAIGALESSERVLLTKLYDFGAAVEAVASTTRPHLLCDYLYDLAGAFSTFYGEHQVLKAEPTVRASRLRLCELTARALKDGLTILGIEVLERM
ncbi:MAG: arginyl-tRNA synthetase [Myxococcales bacterium]|nr:arginyl-tRNA synthetase [Myxococcales bacterium]